MLQNHTCWWASWACGTSKTKVGPGWLVPVALFRKSLCATCSPARVICTIWPDRAKGLIRSIFVEEGLVREWDDRLGIGNPVYHPSIKVYLKCVRGERGQPRVQPRNAIPLFANAFLAIARSILSKLRKPYTSPSLFYILSWDLRIFYIDFSLESVRRTQEGLSLKKCFFFPTPPGYSLERFSIECRKTKTKVITLADHKGHR